MNLVIENLCKDFDGNIILNDVSFEFEKGKIYGLLGKNGSGKTTFFNCLNSDEKLNKGDIYLIDKDSNKYDISYDNIGYLRSIPLLPGFLTGREFVDFFLDINYEYIPNIKSADEYLDDFLIEEDDKDKLLCEYSHGMKNKVLMLINFISSQNILLLDEPLTSFDPLVADDMKKKLKKIKKEQVVILSTHIMEIAIDICDEIILLKDGKFIVIDNLKLGPTKSKKMILNYLKDDNNDL